MKNVKSAELFINTDREKYSGRSKESDNFVITDDGIEFEFAAFSGVLLKLS